MECSEDSSWGQWRSRYTIHASRQSNDKVLRSRLLLPIFCEKLDQKRATFATLSPTKDVLTIMWWRTIISDCFLVSLQGSDFIFLLCKLDIKSLRIFLNEKSFLLIDSNYEFSGFIPLSPMKNPIIIFRVVPAFSPIYIPSLVYLFNSGLKAM